MTAPAASSAPAAEPWKCTGLGHLCKATTYSLAGLAAAFRHEAAFRHDLLLCLVSLVASLLCPLSWDRRLLINVLGLILLACELVNSAVEAVVDLVSPDWHELAKRAKDMGSATVFCLLTALGLTWLVSILQLCGCL